jgi:alpha-galactosidase
MENRYGIMSYRQDLPGFGEPQEGTWDGFQRINTDTKSGGIIGVFRQGGVTSERLVTINYLGQDKLYEVKQMDGKVMATATGKELQTKGFKVALEKDYDGLLLEVSSK